MERAILMLCSFPTCISTSIPSHIGASLSIHSIPFHTSPPPPPGLMSPALDVYAFGVLMWEVYCAQAVFEVGVDLCQSVDICAEMCMYVCVCSWSSAAFYWGL